MVNAELVRQLLKELEAERNGPVQLQVKTIEYYSEMTSLEGEENYLGSFADRPVSVVAVPGEGVEYTMAQQLAGYYLTVKDMFKRLHNIKQPEMLDLDGPMNIEDLFVRGSGIFARMMGTYGDNNIIKAHPGHEEDFEAHRSYDIKVADISLKLIE